MKGSLLLISLPYLCVNTCIFFSVYWMRGGFLIYFSQILIYVRILSYVYWPLIPVLVNRQIMAVFQLIIRSDFLFFWSTKRVHTFQTFLQFIRVMWLSSGQWIVRGSNVLLHFQEILEILPCVILHPFSSNCHSKAETWALEIGTVADWRSLVL